MPIKKRSLTKRTILKKISGIYWEFRMESFLDVTKCLQNDVPFCITVEQAINVHAPLKSCLVRTDKSKIVLD